MGVGDMDRRFENKSRGLYFEGSLDDENEDLILDLESKVHTLKNVIEAFYID